jgi:hypothetical protein
VPGWLKARIREAIKAGRLEPVPHEGWLLDAAVEAATGRCSRTWMDHFGTTTLAEGTEHAFQAFVTEPYACYPEMLQAAARFAELLRLSWEVRANSWHYPGRTIRIVFGPRELPADIAE